MFKGFIETMMKIIGVVFVGIPFILLCIAFAFFILLISFMFFSWPGLVIVTLLLGYSIYKNSKKYRVK